MLTVANTQTLRDLSLSTPKDGGELDAPMFHVQDLACRASEEVSHRIEAYKSTPLVCSLFGVQKTSSANTPNPDDIRAMVRADFADTNVAPWIVNLIADNTAADLWQRKNFHEQSSKAQPGKAPDSKKARQRRPGEAKRPTDPRTRTSRRSSPEGLLKALRSL